MTDILIGTPARGQLETALTLDRAAMPPPARPSQLSDNATRSEIARLAYALWEERGCPTGSAESDWLEAERRFMERLKTDDLLRTMQISPDRIRNDVQGERNGSMAI